MNVRPGIHYAYRNMTGAFVTLCDRDAVDVTYRTRNGSLVTCLACRQQMRARTLREKRMGRPRGTKNQQSVETTKGVEL